LLVRVPLRRLQQPARLHAAIWRLSSEFASAEVVKARHKRDVRNRGFGESTGRINRRENQQGRICSVENIRCSAHVR
jgi:hypothetical protein